MGLSDIKQRLAERAAETTRKCPANVSLVKSAEVCRGLQRSGADLCTPQTRPTPNLTEQKSQDTEVAEVFNSFTYAGARTRTRTGGENIWHHQPPLPTQPLRALKPARCSRCVKFERIGETFYCRAGIGGTHVVWGTGQRTCTPAPDQDHWCDGFREPQP